MSKIGYINVALETFGGIMSLIFIICLRITRPKRDHLEQLYIRLLTCNTILLFFDAAAWLFKGRADGVGFYAVRISNVMVYLLGYVMLALFTHYLVCFLREKGVQVVKTPVYVMGALVLLAMVLVLVSQWNGMYYVFDEHNVYHRQSWFWLSQAFGVAGLVINTSLLVRYRTHLNRREIATFCAYICLPIVALLFQILFYSIAVLYLATTVCLLCIYISIQLEVSRQVAMKELELEKSRITLMLSQIQPHFLFNTLSGIKQLCDTEPKKASDALGHFAYYLQGNLYSLSDPEPIPFEKEVEHVKDYLYLEKMRFDERISICWELHETAFALPTLTLQPIVENAVRHGIAKKTGGGTLTIRSEGTPDAVIITVADDGVGYDLLSRQDNSRPHIGIENVKRRLEMQCGGSLHIQSQPEKGTEVTIVLPRKFGA